MEGRKEEGRGRDGRVERERDREREFGGASVCLLRESEWVNVCERKGEGGEGERQRERERQRESQRETETERRRGGERDGERASAPASSRAHFLRGRSIAERASAPRAPASVCFLSFQPSMPSRLSLLSSPAPNSLVVCFCTSASSAFGGCVRAYVRVAGMCGRSSCVCSGRPARGPASCSPPFGLSDDPCYLCTAVRRPPSSPRPPRVLSLAFPRSRYRANPAIPCPRPRSSARPLWAARAE